MTSAPLRPTRPRLVRWKRALLLILGALAVLSNLVAFAVAWSMTHYEGGTVRQPAFNRLSPLEKLGRLSSDFALPRAASPPAPGRWARLEFSTVHYPGARGIQLEAWRIPGAPEGPIVLLFHGYGGCKSTLNSAAEEFHALGCETWMVDFHGSGGSAGNSTTIGYDEAEDVAATVREALRPGARRPLVLYGASMGAAAILCAMQRYNLQPDALIMECPFDRLVTTAGNRCRMLGLPAFPAAEMLVLWGGIQSHFNGFAHNPVEYARCVRCPSLLMQGGLDERVGLPSARAVAAALGARCTFEIFPKAGHMIPLRSTPEWHTAVRQFLASNLGTVSH